MYIYSKYVSFVQCLLKFQLKFDIRYTMNEWLKCTYIIDKYSTFIILTQRKSVQSNFDISKSPLWLKTAVYTVEDFGISGFFFIKEFYA